MSKKAMQYNEKRRATLVVGNYRSKRALLQLALPFSPSWRSEKKNTVLFSRTNDAWLADSFEIPFSPLHWSEKTKRRQDSGKRIGERRRGEGEKLHKKRILTCIIL